MTCGSCGNGGNCGSDCSKPSGWWDNEFGYNPYGYNQAPVVRPNWWNEQFAPQVIGVGKTNAELTIEIEKCAEAAYGVMQANGDLATLLNNGYSNQDVRNMIIEKCTEEITGAKIEEDRLIYQNTMNGTVVAKTWLAVSMVAIPAIATGVIGYFIGKRR